MPAHKHISRESVLALKARGFSYPHIARTLGVHVQTVKYHVRGVAPSPTTRRCPVCHGLERLDQPHPHGGAA
jgi:hypothetical protein